MVGSTTGWVLRLTSDVVLLHRDGRCPGVAVHLDRGLRPVAREDAALGRGLLAQARRLWEGGEGAGVSRKVVVSCVAPVVGSVRVPTHVPARPQQTRLPSRLPSFPD